jgi:hypothetical protein
MTDIQQVINCYNDLKDTHRETLRVLWAVTKASGGDVDVNIDIDNLSQKDGITLTSVPRSDGGYSVLAEGP